MAGTTPGKTASVFRSVTDIAPALAGALFGNAFHALAVLRRGRPLHPKGVVFDAVVRRSGSGDVWGVEWLDSPGEDHGTARLSRSVGLPGPVPDICGLAITFAGRGGNRHDLLLATTGLAVGSRFVLIPRRDPPTSSYGSLFPYLAPGGPVMIAAVPAIERRQLEAATAASFRLMAAGLTGPWREFAVLDLTERPGNPADEPLRFDPVRYPLPGLRWPRALAQLREPAYLAAQRVPVRRLSRSAGFWPTVAGSTPDLTRFSSINGGSHGRGQAAG